MPRPTVLASLAGASLLASEPAFAHGFAGPHMFISTLLIDDPNVADEASLPTFSFLPQPNDGGTTPGLYGLNFEFDKRITENFGFSVSDGYQWLHTPGAGTASGWENVELGLKYKIYVNPEHEFMLSLGVFREFGRTGATGDTGAALDVDQTSSTTPTIFCGKGFGDLPIGLLRPVAITGTLGYSIADQEAEGDWLRPRYRQSSVQQRHVQSMDRWPVAAIQHALPAGPGEGLSASLSSSTS